jgi:hypothetical protein
MAGGSSSIAVTHYLSRASFHSRTAGRPTQADETIPAVLVPDLTPCSQKFRPAASWQSRNVA